MNKQLSQDLKIDRNALDEALILQPELFLRASLLYTEAVSDRDAAKETVSVVHASRSLKIRRKSVEDGTKLTEAIVASMIEKASDYREAMSEYLSCKQQAEEALAVKEAFQQRGYVLKDLASLYIAGYFTSSSVQGKASRDVQQESYARSRETLAKRRRSKNE